jgi:hypothetical protein
MLEARFGLPDVTALPQAAAPDGLFMRSLDTGRAAYWLRNSLVFCLWRAVRSAS